MVADTREDPSRPPRIITIECSCRFALARNKRSTSMPVLVSLTRATLRSAEFGFLGVVCTPCRHPFWGASHPGALLFHVTPPPVSDELLIVWHADSSNCNRVMISIELLRYEK